jgi:hypothetical protein
MNSVFKLGTVQPSLARVGKFVRIAACISGIVVLAGCAHPISIEPKAVPSREGQWSSQKAAYVMTEADRQKQVTTQGGGGDKISYYPYRDFERSLRAALASVYADVSAVGSVSDAAAIRASGASFVYRPEISTTSSSPSPFTWPPTKFSASVLVEVFNPQAVLVARLRVTGNGAAEWEEFKGDFGLAGRRAVEDAARALVEEIKRSEKLR